MPLSTSSSRELSAKTGSWPDVLKLGAIIALIVVVILELWVGVSGYRPGVKDSAELWAFHRERARLIDDPVILIGGSRLQLGISLEAMETFTNRPVVQLAIDGQKSLGVFRSIVEDPDISGTLIVSLYETELTGEFYTSQVTDDWISRYEKRHRGTIAPNIEAFLQTGFQEISRFHAVELPTRVLFSRLIEGSGGQIYLKTSIWRDRYANYELVPQPQFYLGRVLRNLGETIQLKERTIAGFNQAVREKLKQETRGDRGNLVQRIADLKDLVTRFEARGGNVIFVKMPTDKLVKEIDEARIPVQEVWKAINSSGIRALDTSTLKDIDQFPLPDGSHLDLRQKAPFTILLLRELRSRKWI